MLSLGKLNVEVKETEEERSVIHRKRKAEGFFLYSLLEIKQRYLIPGKLTNIKRPKIDLKLFP